MVVFISVYPITWLINTELGRAPLNFEPSGHQFTPNFTPKYLHPFHRGVSLELVGLYPHRLVYPKTAWYSFPFTPSLGLYNTELGRVTPEL